MRFITPRCGRERERERERGGQQHKNNTKWQAQQKRRALERRRNALFIRPKRVHAGHLLEAPSDILK
jgi:hypothetical protein